MQFPVTVDRLDTLTHEQAASVAALTRDAYRHSDPVPGLPAPDGASDTWERVLGSLRSGGWVWRARDGGGRTWGVLRMRPRGSVWWVSRLAVHPDARGRGVGHRLLGAAALHAEAAGASALCLNAVVERELPQFYTRLGFLVRLRWPAPDNPLTEVTMVRTATDRYRPADWPWRGDGAFATTAAVLTWWRQGGRMRAVVAATTAGPMLVLTAANRPGGRQEFLTGADQLPGGTADTVAELSTRLREEGGRQRDDGSIEFDSGLPLAYLMPRRVSPRLQALWRCAAGLAVPGRGRREARQ